MNAGDTICAIATPPGEGGIGIIRLSGEKALDIASTVFAGSGGRTVRDYRTHTLHHGELRAPDTGVRIDEVLVAVMKAPRRSWPLALKRLPSALSGSSRPRKTGASCEKA